MCMKCLAEYLISSKLSTISCIILLLFPNICQLMAQPSDQTISKYWLTAFGPSNNVLGNNVLRARELESELLQNYAYWKVSQTLLNHLRQMVYKGGNHLKRVLSASDTKATYVKPSKWAVLHLLLRTGTKCWLFIYTWDIRYRARYTVSNL